MSVSDVIQIISIICTSILSLVAIIISILTLIQNNKMIFESSKPNITIFSKVISFTSPHSFLIVKNFGNSAAIIKEIKYDKILNSYFEKEPFEHMKNTLIAPNQSFVYPLEKYAKSDEVINFEIIYTYLNKTYTEKCSVNFSHFKDICFIKFHGSKDIKEISDILQEMTFQNL